MSMSTRCQDRCPAAEKLRGALAGSSAFLHLLHLRVGFGRDRSLQLGRSSHFLRVLAHVRIGEARLSGHNLESGAGHC